MTTERKIAHQRVMIASLIFCVATIPFSVKLCHLGMLVLIGAWIFEGGWKTKYETIGRSIFLQLIIAYVLIQATGLIFSERIAEGWYSVEKKAFLLMVPLVLATSSIRLTLNHQKNILWVFVLSCFVGSVLCLLHAWSQSDFILSGAGRVNPYLSGSAYADLHPQASQQWLVFSYVSLADGIGIHPTYFSVFVAFSLIFLSRELASVKGRAAKSGIALVMGYFAILIVFLASRIVIIALAVYFVYLVIRSLLRREFSLSWIVALIGVLYFSLVWISPVTRYRTIEEISLTRFELEPQRHYTTATDIRFTLWGLAVKSLYDWNPLTGKGTGNVENSIRTTASGLGITNSINSSDPHNQFLYSLLANGIPALLLLVACLLFPVYYGFTRNDDLLLAFGFLFGLLSITESAFELQKGIAFYSLVCGLLFFQSKAFEATLVRSKSVLRASP